MHSVFRFRLQVGIASLVLIAVVIIGIFFGFSLRSDQSGKADDIAVMTAYHSDDYVDMYGAVTHLHHRYKYDTSLFEDHLKPRIIELGLRHLREHLGALDPEFVTFHNRMASLAPYGVDVSYTIDHNVGSNDPAGLLITKLKTMMNGGTIAGRVLQGGQLISNLEGDNEQDHCPSFEESCQAVGGTWYDKSQAYRPNWENILVDNMNPLRAALDSDSQTAPLNIVGPSYVHVHEFNIVPGLTELLQGMNGNFSAGNGHIYCGLQRPLSTCYPSVMTPLQNFYGSLPTVITEWGYHNSGNSESEVSERLASKYIQRGGLDFFKRGIRRAYLYELWDEGNLAPTEKEGSFGILRHDGSPKEVFTDLKNTFDLLKDADQSFTPVNYRVQVVGETSGVKSLLFQKSNGAYYLVMWYEPTTSTENDVTKTATVNFANTPGFMNLYRPGQSATALSTYNGQTALNLTIPDEPVILEIFQPTPGATESPSPAPTATPTPTPSASGSSGSTPTPTPTPSPSANANSGGGGRSAGENSNTGGSGTGSGETGGATTGEDDIETENSGEAVSTTGSDTTSDRSSPSPKDTKKRGTSNLKELDPLESVSQVVGGFTPLAAGIALTGIGLCVALAIIIHLRKIKKP